MSWDYCHATWKESLSVLPEMKLLSQEKLEVKREGKMLKANKPLRLLFHEPGTIFPSEFRFVS